jgi:hypothetical protein
MPTAEIRDLVILARIVQDDDGRYMVIVSTISADPLQTDNSGTIKSGEAATLELAEALREKLVPLVQAACRLRGHRVSKVERVGPG